MGFCHLGPAGHSAKVFSLRVFRASKAFIYGFFSFGALGNSYLRVSGVLGLERHLEAQVFSLRVGIYFLRVLE